jgi:hypothetical protein
MGIVKAIKESFAEAVEKTAGLGKNKVLSTIAVALMIGASSAFATGGVTLPTTGIDVAEYVTAAITGLGVVLAAVVGGYFAFLLVKKGLKWAGKALG